MAFLSMWTELVGTIPNLNAFLAQTYIQRAWLDICRTRSWSFKQQVAYLNSPLQITAGRVAVTQFSASVTADVTAKAALDIASAAGNPALVGRQFRPFFKGPIYTISAYDIATGVLTLDAPYQSATNPTSTYTVYKCLYQSPVTPFQRFLSIEDPNNGYSFSRLHVPKAVLDKMDPTRSSQQLPYMAAEYDAAGTRGNVRYEFWPHPITAQTFVCALQVTQTSLVLPGDTLPDIIPDGLVVAQAMLTYAIPWAIANAPRFPNMKGTNFTALANEQRKNHAIMLQGAKKDDDGRMLKSRLIRSPNRRGAPIDANYIQDHDITRTW